MKTGRLPGEAVLLSAPTYYTSIAIQLCSASKPFLIFLESNLINLCYLLRSQSADYCKSLQFI
ncbi:hypothetical protein C7B65_08060 [Phormidesmis priestleyi ULC007]|uniref:Uncharacterized protein n=1 Tax=Phormidesmis priestleyi ULC007 TaxID=1920490 RepID=A0A2T1DIT1_9CYAN|nr:hypothetical protein C7B65_08060 [Phormidesmis priestleyi ULC007]PZO52959.1 MAG: hypothetical protein DCF14_04890 [Phormidesmis priestleyi]